MDEIVRKRYEYWLSDPCFDEATKDELRALKGDEAEITDRFYRQLEFGTGGLRGVIGAGTNRMNIYTVRQATQGLANYILSQGGGKKTFESAAEYRKKTRSEKNYRVRQKEYFRKKQADREKKG